MRWWLRRLTRLLGYDLVEMRVLPQYQKEFAPIVELVQPYTMTSGERIVALVRAVRYLVNCRIPGAIVECGVWRGGSMMAAALALLDAGDTTRDLFLFDTFEGMPAPGKDDVKQDGRPATQMFEARRRPDREGSDWCRASMEEVQRNLQRVRYPSEQWHVVKGKVEDTVPARAPARIALLRLDTDWYESTRHELVHLYQRLEVGGVLLIDDYGAWRGARKAVDEYFTDRGIRMLLHHVDYTGVIGVKTDA